MINLPFHRTDDAVSILTQKGEGWSDFGACSKTCGEGIKTRVCNRLSNSGFPCRGKSVTKCNMGPCGSEDNIRPENHGQHPSRNGRGDAGSKDDDTNTTSDDSTPTTELQLLVQLSKDGEQRFHPGCCKERNMFV